MNTTVLINKLDLKDEADHKRKMFFMIGNLPAVEGRVMDLMKRCPFVDETSVVYKYNGVDVSLGTDEIPTLVRTFTEAGIDLYNIYEEYEPR